MKEEGKTQREIAEELDINQSTVSRNMQTDKCQSASTPDYFESEEPSMMEVMT